MLYNKYRPTSFDQIIGNETVLANLRDMIARDDPPHAILLSGPTGCGKTTIGRIVMRELGCDPTDITEIDSADFRGIETARTIRHNAHYKALRGLRRGWIIDECHKLTNEAQNALLKGLEDPPDHCYFVLATTDPDRLLGTVRGRCSLHSVHALKKAEILRLLSRVCAGEGVSVSRKVLEAIALKSSNVFEPEVAEGRAQALAKAAEAKAEKAKTPKEKAEAEEEKRKAQEKVLESASFHPRNAIQLLEKVLASPPENHLQIIEETEELETTVGKLVAILLEQGQKGGWKLARKAIATLSEDDVERARRGVLGYCNQALLKGSNRSEMAAEIINKFQAPFFDSGLAGFTLACYAAMHRN